APAAPMTNGQAVQQAYLFAFGRQPSDTERRRMSEFLVAAAAPTAASPAVTPPAAGTPTAATPGANGSSDPSAAPVTDAALVEFCHALLCLNEFLYVD
ncbi:MAG TPA: hypothetical protein PLV92_01425, partial [Pirellulaceae bacterium]|nr:hypothetical protein [Pirellulaceae bacterium]